MDRESEEGGREGMSQTGEREGCRENGWNNRGIKGRRGLRRYEESWLEKRE